jgi:adenylate kinase family enzyme
MKRVAVFGNAGGGKSILARRPAELTRLPLYPLDLIQFKPGGVKIPHQEYLKAHADLEAASVKRDGVRRLSPITCN